MTHEIPTVAAWLNIGPQDQPGMGAQRLHVVEEGSQHLRRFMLNHLGVALGGALFAITGEDKAYNLGVLLAKTQRNITVGISGGMAATVYPAHAPSGVNLSRSAPQYFATIEDAYRVLTAESARNASAAL